MAKLTLKFNVPYNSSYNVTVENKGETIEKTVDSTRKTLDFNLEGDVKVYIEQTFEPMGKSWLVTAFRLLTMPFYGAYVTVFQLNDTEWEKNICAFGIKSLLSFNVSEDSEYIVELINSTFDAKTKCFTLPEVKTVPAVLIKNEKTENSVDIEEKFGNFIRKSYSSFSLMLLLCAIVFYNGIFGSGNVVITALTVGVTFVLFVATVWANIRNRKKRELLYKIYKSQTEK